MPCTDVTERIEVKLDPEDRVAEYALAKRTCGQAVGAESLIGEALAGLSTDAVLAIAPERLVTELLVRTTTEEFLVYKHLFAVQAALEAYVGTEPGSATSPFAVAEIVFDHDGTTITGVLSVDVLTEKIEACGGCRSCGAAGDKARVSE